MESNIVEQISDNLIFGTNLQLVKDADIVNFYQISLFLIEVFVKNWLIDCGSSF